MKLTKNHIRVTEYIGTNYETYENTNQNAQYRFFLYNTETKEMVSQSNNPMKFDKLVYKD